MSYQIEAGLREQIGDLQKQHDEDQRKIAALVGAAEMAAAFVSRIPAFGDGIGKEVNKAQLFMAELSLQKVIALAEGKETQS